MALQKVIDILRDAGTESTVFTNTLPKGKQEVCRIFVLKQKIDFVDNDKSVFTLCAIGGNTVEDTVKHNEHTNRQKLFSEIENVVADKTVVYIYIGFFRKCVK